MRRPWIWLVLATAMWGCGSREGAAPNATASLPLLSIPAANHPGVKQALDQLQQGQTAESLATATAAVNQQPENAALYDARAHIYHSTGQINAALADLHRAVELDPTNARYLNNRGFLLLGLHHLEAAYTDFNAAHQLDPELVSVYNNRALVEITRGRFRQAVVDLDEALKRDPKYVDALNNHGFALMQLGRLDRALADFNAAVTFNPKYTNAWNNRGLVKRQMGDLEGAMLDFTQAMLLDPNNAKYYEHRRDVYLLQGELQKAKEDERKIQFLVGLKSLSSLIAQSPQHPAGYLARAEHFRKQGDDAAARRDYDQAVALSALDDTVAVLRRANFLLACNNVPAAIADCERVLKQREDPFALSLRGDCRKAQRDYDGALADYEAAKRLDEAVIETYALKADDFARRGKPDEAERLRKKAAELAETLVPSEKTAGPVAQPFPADDEVINVKRTATVAQPFPE